MEITTKQAKRLKYLAHCYSDSTYTTVHTDDGKAKRRAYPTLDVSYIEKTLGGGAKVLSDILVSGNPFTGTFEELEKIIECGNPHTDAAQETLPPDPPIVQRLKESETGKNFENMAAAVSELAHSEMKVVKSEITGLSEDGTLTVDVHAIANNTADSVNVHIDVDKLEEQNVQEDTADASESAKFVEDPEKKTIVVTGPVCHERHDSGRDYSGLSEEAIAEAYASVVSESKGDIKPSVEVAVEEAKKVAEETGTPVITAEQRKDTIHLDAAVEGTKDKTVVINNPQPKKPTMADLINLRMRCATIRLAEVYGERPDITINEIMVKYPGAIADFNDFLYKDGVKPYTISLESIRKAYPREYPIATNKDGN